MGSSNAEEAAGTILTSGGHTPRVDFPGIDDSSIRVVEALDAYESEESVPPGPDEILSRGDLIRIKAQIKSALTLLASTDLGGICEVIMPIASSFNLPSFKGRRKRQAIHGRTSLPEDSQDVIEHLGDDNKKYAIAVTTSYVRIYYKDPYFYWVLTHFSRV